MCNPRAATTGRNRLSHGCSRSSRRNTVSMPCCAAILAGACVEGARQGYRAVRAELSERVPAHVIDGILVAYRTEGKRLAATSRAVGLVERALHGEALTPRT